ncbi:hypothetical protein D9M71_826470 [compost metagenome]
MSAMVLEYESLNGVPMFWSLLPTVGPPPLLKPSVNSITAFFWQELVMGAPSSVRVNCRAAAFTAWRFGVPPLAVRESMSAYNAAFWSAFSMERMAKRLLAAVPLS